MGNIVHFHDVVDSIAFFQHTTLSIDLYFFLFYERSNPIDERESLDNMAGN